MARNTRRGIYTPKNPHKYNGDITKIRYMSSWELSVNQFLDNNPNILEWGSEEVVVPYTKPTDGKVHKYYVDYYVKYKTRNGEIKKELWEVKPKKETRPPSGRGKNKKTQLYENLTWVINQAKWTAAVAFAKKYNLTFRLVTEDQIFK